MSNSPTRPTHPQVFSPKYIQHRFKDILPPSAPLESVPYSIVRKLLVPDLDTSRAVMEALAEKTITHLGSMLVECPEMSVSLRVADQLYVKLLSGRTIATIIKNAGLKPSDAEGLAQHALAKDRYANDEVHTTFSGLNLMRGTKANERHLVLKTVIDPNNITTKERGELRKIAQELAGLDGKIQSGIASTVVGASNRFVMPSEAEEAMQARVHQILPLGSPFSLAPPEVHFTDPQVPEEVLINWELFRT